MILARLVARELRLALERGAALPLAFFLLVAILFPFAVGPDAPLLAQTGPGVLWMAALLAGLLPVERLFEPDAQAGVLDQLAAHGLSDELIAAAKMVAHWLSFGPLLLLAALPAAMLLRIDAPALARLEIALAIGTPGLAALGLAVAALTAGLRGAGALAGLLMLPLAVPLLIFGAGATGAVGGAEGGLQLLAATSLIYCAAAPFVAGAAVRATRD